MPERSRGHAHVPSVFAAGRLELIKSGPRESLASHLTVFAAERARLNGTVEMVPPAT